MAPYIQSQRRDTYGKYARLLVEKGGAYYCFCEKTESEEDSGEFDRAADPCRELTAQQVQEKLEAGLPYVIRQRIPAGTTTFHDVHFRGHHRGQQHAGRSGAAEAGRSAHL